MRLLVNTEFSSTLQAEQGASCSCFFVASYLKKIPSLSQNLELSSGSVRVHGTDITEVVVTNFEVKTLPIHTFDTQMQE
jgi:hypothetical protein